jgi:hypothetical protein
MGDYVCTRVWQLKPGVSAGDVEALASSGMVEILSWIPGIKRFSLCQLLGEPRGYLMSMSFVDYGSYMYWRQVEGEAADYWEHFAAVLAQWEQLCQLVEEYAGDRVVDVVFEEKYRKKASYL